MKIQIRLKGMAKRIVLLLFFIATIVGYKYLGIYNTLQEWYHIIWQWILISSSGKLYFENENKIQGR